MHYTSNGLMFDESLSGGLVYNHPTFGELPLVVDRDCPPDSVYFLNPNLVRVGDINRSTYSFWRDQTREEKQPETLPEILERHYTRLSGQNVAFDSLKGSIRKVYDQCSASLLTPEIMVTSPRMLGVLEGIEETLDVPRSGVFDEMEYSWKMFEGGRRGGKVTSAREAAGIQAASNPIGNRGQIVAVAWEKYVGSQAVDNILDREYFSEIEAPIEYTTGPEQPTLGLITPCQSEGSHIWSDYRMVCDRCGITQQELANGRHA